MEIVRLGTTKRWSDATIYNHVVYIVEVPISLNGDLKSQTLEVLGLIEKRLLNCGSSKEQILMVTIYLRDIQQIDVFNQIWDNWLPEGGAPVRACVEAKLANPEYLVEIQLTAVQVDKSVAAVNFMT